MKLTTTLYPTPNDHDSDDIRWEDEEGKQYGYGYMGKEGERVIHIVRCPMCSNENYMKQPVCIKCGFAPNPDEIKTHNK